MLGELSVIVTCQGTNHSLLLLVVKENGPSLIGRNWLTKIQLDQKNIFTVTGEWQLDELLYQHSSVFEDKLGSVRDMKVKLFVEENSKPKFFKAHHYTCLPFGVASALAIFQRIMEKLFKGLPMVIAYLDAILVAGKAEQEH